MKHCQPDGIRGAVLLMALAVTVLLGGCADRKSEPVGADAALTQQVAEPAVSTTPEAANPETSTSPNAADEAVGPPESATPMAASPRSPAAPEPARPRAPGIAVGEPDPTHPAPISTDAHPHVQRDSGAVTGKSSSGADCQTDSDCAIKDVGSCCGYRPQCVNKNTPTFPEQVRARCGHEGRVGICGFPAITGCQCVAGKCSGITLSDDSTQVQ